MKTEDRWVVHIHDLDDLIALQEECGCELILGEDAIEIYDTYRE